MTKVNTAKAVSKTPAAKAAPAKVAAQKPDVIKSVKGAVGGGHVVVVAGGENKLTYPKNRESAELVKLAVVGASFKAVQSWLKANKPDAKLATGLDGRNAPNCAKAVADQRAAGKSTPTNGAGSAKVPVKSGKVPSAKVPAGADRAYKLGAAVDTSRPGTWRNYMLATIRAHKSTAEANAAHAKSGKFSGNKLDFNWSAKQGYIAFS
jgi:hypothetical protein